MVFVQNNKEYKQLATTMQKTIYLQWLQFQTQQLSATGGLYGVEELLEVIQAELVGELVVQQVGELGCTRLWFELDEALPARTRSLMPQTGRSRVHSIHHGNDLGAIYTELGGVLCNCVDSTELQKKTREENY